jgi:hypothetical protein
MISIESIDRWQAYHRFQALGLTCSCQGHQALTVQVDSPLDLLQVWAVVQAVDSPRSALILWLERSWHLPVAGNR